MQCRLHAAAAATAAPRRHELRPRLVRQRIWLVLHWVLRLPDPKQLNPGARLLPLAKRHLSARARASGWSACPLAAAASIGMVDGVGEHKRTLRVSLQERAA